MDARASQLSARLLNLIQTGFDTQTGAQSDGDGREAVHAIYPNEIECYACALELVDGNDNSVGFFAFPVMPNSISENRITNAGIENTLSGIVVLNNPTFVPFDINLSGTFGKRFRKVQLSNTDSNTTKKTNLPETEFRPFVFDNEYKTGYGCYKIMEDMIERSMRQDSNFLPYKLFFYNLSKNSNYLVEPISLVPNQSRDSSNMMWQYNLTLRAIAPAKAISKNYKTSLKTLTDYSRMSRTAVFSAEELKQYTVDQTTKVSKVQKLFQRQVLGRALGSMSVAQQSMLQAVISLTLNPNDLDDFLLNVGEGILNRF